MNETLRELIFAHMAEEGIEPRSEIDFICDGKVHRFATQDDSYGHKSGAYYIYDDSVPNWGIMDFHKHTEFQKRKLAFDDLPKERQQEIREQIAREKPVDNKAIEEEQIARKRAFCEYQRASAKPVNRHPYYKLKQITLEDSRIRVVTWPKSGDFCRRGDLLIPLMNCLSREFQTLERISYNHMPNGKHLKGLYPKTHRAGACFEFPTKNPEQIIICEGFATGASIHSVMRKRNIVVCATCWSNIINIARIWRKRCTLPIIIAADNDEAGLRGATQAIEAGYANEIFTPPIAGMDWNDYIIKTLQ